MFMVFFWVVSGLKDSGLVWGRGSPSTVLSLAVRLQEGIHYRVLRFRVPQFSKVRVSEKGLGFRVGV